MRKSIPAVVLGLLLFGSSPAFAAATVEAETIHDYVDGYVGEGMEGAGVPGLTFVLVDREGIVFATAYGLADIGAGRPMTTDTPLRVGSISKPVTSAIALELEADGVIDLDVPVDAYLPVQLDDDYGPASTIRQLLQHRGGYPDAFVESHHLDSEESVALEEWIERRPRRSLAPDVVASYSSVGYTVAGAAMAGAAGESFEALADRMLFGAVGMSGATFAPPGEGDVATGYSWNGEGHEAYPTDVPDLVPGAGLVATAEDVGLFMSALLAETGPLSDSTKEALLTLAGPGPGLRGYTTGLAEWQYEERTVLYHEGNGIGTSSRMMILPEEGIGVFTAVNAETLVGTGGASGQVRFVRDLHEGIVEEILPSPREQISAPRSDGSGVPASDVAGTYLPTRIDPDSFVRLEALLSQMEVRATSDGIALGSVEYAPSSPGLYSRPDGGDIVFLEGADGVTYATRGGTSSYRVAAWWETTVFNIAFLVGALSLLTAGAFLGRRRLPAVTKRLLLATTLVSLTFVVLLAVGMATIDVMELFTGVPAPLRLAQLSAIGLVVTTVALAVTGVGTLRRRATPEPDVSWLGVASVVAVIIAAAALTGWAWAWGVIPV